MLWSRILNILPCSEQARSKECPRNTTSAKVRKAGLEGSLRQSREKGLQRP